MKTLLKLFKWLGATLLVLVLAAVGYEFYVIKSFDTQTPPKNHGHVQARLFLGKGESQPLIVGLGGSEGGNAWASDHWKAQRDRFLAQGYAFLAVGYFGMPGTPAHLDRIELDAIDRAAQKAAQNPQVNGHCIAVMGGSRGGELALLLASRYPDFKAAIGIVPGSAVFPALTRAMNTAGFSDHGHPLAFVPMQWSAVPAMLSGDRRGAFAAMLKNRKAVRRATIKVENINGPVLLLSGKTDAEWPSTEMSDAMIQRLKRHHFPYYAKHVAYPGGHGAPLKHFDRIERFLSKHFPADDDSSCAR